jgi:cellulose 1,4-beta-cellobiosidase
LTWEDGVNNGGMPITEYRISQKVQGGSFSVIATGITETNYVASGLTLGTIYEWQVEALNSVGYSLPSVGFENLHALIPGIPSDLTTTNTGTNIVFDWTAPSDNGSAISSYSVTIRQNDGIFSQDTINCNGEDATIIANS